MLVPFSKYHGTGNDFIIIDNRSARLTFTENEIALLCHRRFGIGADGLMLLNNSQNYAFDMQYYNSDGKLGSMCGNGGRCIVAFAKRLQLFESIVEFMAFDGTHSAEVFTDEASLKFSSNLFQNNTLVKLAMQEVSEIESFENGFILNTGSPHYVLFVNNVLDIDVYVKGKEIRNHARFMPNGTNVNFVEIKNNSLFVRTYERGVEDETFSCGTGVVASALVFAQQNKLNTVNVETKGGNLQVFLQQTNPGFKNIYLQGFATHIFDGSFILNKEVPLRGV